MDSRAAVAALAAIALVVAVFAAALGDADAPRTAVGAGRLPAVADGALAARVVRVVDGDTVRVQDAGGAQDTVRYIGVDTPESVKPGAPVECFAKAASHRNAVLVAGRRVRLVAGAEPRDRHGRLLAYVYRAQDGRFVNEALLADGFARTLTIRPNDRHATRFAAAEEPGATRPAGPVGVVLKQSRQPVAEAVPTAVPAT